jgi:hypothetical protein
MKIKQNFTDFLKKLTIEKKKCCMIALIKTQDFSLEIFLIWHTLNEIQDKLIYDSE